MSVIGRVFETLGGTYVVNLPDGETVEASLRGRLKKSGNPMDRIVVGDRVHLETSGDAYVIHAVEPRTTTLMRARLGGRYPKPVAANLDRLFAVAATDQPTPSPELIDRLLVLAEAGGMAGVVVLNKTDLESGRAAAQELSSTYGAVGYPVHLVSAKTGAGMEELAADLCDGWGILAGASGVGKSSLLSWIQPNLNLRVGELGSTGAGRHTTVSARLIPLECGGYVVDSPGFSDAGLWGITPAELSSCFPEMRRLAEGCRFRECTHHREPDCAVLEAVAEGVVAPSRHASYLALADELA